ncbi:hypothetical protein J7U46_17030 [Pelomonas sp. V22]|uniref:hypothetical protein n=1 Tax=Pelomonas sp. V22 TaxID=2822139 RepID=UPI0024A99719|nr:hypothetical protein [Pelomonas sp. V22]MDI4634768.1 hypothetical protein [Pelomonas sp. V22]
MNTATTPGLMASFVSAARQALQWRLLLLWLLALALPTLLTILPLWMVLGGALDKSLLADKLVEGFDPAVLVELIGGLGQRGYSANSGFAGVAMMILLLPWLSGTLIAVARSTVVLSFVGLLQGGLREYGRMARLWLWALLPLGLALVIGGALAGAAKEHGQTLVLESDAEWLARAALAVGALVFLLAHATLDAARARLALEPQRRSVLKAWWLATKELLRRPGRILLYVGITLLGLALAGLIGLLRIQVAPVGAASFAAALLLAQLIALALVWMRCTRMLALVNAGRN